MYPHYRPDAHSRPHVPWRVLPSNGPLRGHGPSWHQPHTIPSSSSSSSSRLASIPYPPSYHAQPSTSLPEPLPQEILGSSDGLRLGPVNAAAKKRKLVKDSRSEDDIEAVARRLYSKLLAVPRFRSYRDGDRKKGPSAKTIWPDPVEFTLFRAIVRFPPCWHERKPRLGEDHGALGRNQLVADILERVTGHKRTRKQISSHLQVLKGYVGVDQFLTPYLVSPEAKAAKRKKTQKLGKRKRALKDDDDDEASADDDQTRLGVQDVDDLSDSEDKVSVADRFNLRCVEFEMTAWPVVSQEIAKDAHDPLHVYTRAIGRTHQMPFEFADLQHCLEHYPELSFADLPLFADTPIMCGEATLTPASHAVFSGKNDLHIKFFLSGPRLPGMTRTQTRTLLFENGIPFMNIVKDGCMEFSKVDGMEVCRYQIPFFSKQWVTRLAKWGKATDEIKALERDSSYEHETKRVRELRIDRMQQQVAQQIKSMTAVQEIYVGDDISTAMLPLMMVHWSFSQAPIGQPGRTYWRRLGMERPHHMENKDAPVSVAEALRTFDAARPSADIFARVRQLGTEYETAVESTRGDQAGQPHGPIMIEPRDDEIWHQYNRRLDDLYDLAYMHRSLPVSMNMDHPAIAGLPTDYTQMSMYHASRPHSEVPDPDREVSQLLGQGQGPDDTSLAQSDSPEVKAEPRDLAGSAGQAEPTSSPATGSSPAPSPPQAATNASPLTLQDLQNLQAVHDYTRKRSRPIKQEQ